jgi:hypothetical protein
MTKQKCHPEHTKAINQYIMCNKHQGNNHQCPTQKKRIGLYPPIMIKMNDRQKQKQNGHQKNHAANLPEHVRIKENRDFQNLSR